MSTARWPAMAPAACTATMRSGPLRVSTAGRLRSATSAATPPSAALASSARRNMAWSAGMGPGGPAARVQATVSASHAARRYIPT